MPSSLVGRIKYISRQSRSTVKQKLGFCHGPDIQDNVTNKAQKSMKRPSYVSK
jgi:hypothetical protein